VQEREMGFSERIQWLAVLLVVLIATFPFKLSPQTSPSHEGQTTATNPAWAEFMKGMDKMHSLMSSINTSKDVDTDFVHLMIPHHEAAIDMAKTELAYGKDPQMRRLAQEIITDQRSEIDLMQLWQKQHDSH
jgi:uncharacterized protein (DUF305 family)